MNKATRLLSIASIVARIGKPYVRGTVNASAAEIEEEVSLAVKHNDDQSIDDVEIVEAGGTYVSPALAEVLRPAKDPYHAPADALLLSAGEKAEVARVRAEVKAAKEKWYIALPLKPLPELIELAG